MEVICSQRVKGLTRASPLNSYRGMVRFSAAAMRVCHPLPVRFQCASTSASMRILICTLGLAKRGRPRGLRNSSATAWPNNSGSTSVAGRARAKSSSVNSGLSASIISGSALFILHDLSRIRPAQADNVGATLSASKHKHMHAAVDSSNCLEPGFAIRPAYVFDDGCRAPVEVFCQAEMKLPLLDIACVLCWIVADSSE